MKWFKHDSDSSMDAKLQEILLDYGLEGYGLYWYCLELIASNVDKNNLNFELEHDARIIARNTGNTAQKVQEMMAKFIDLGLFENVDGVVTCLKMMTRTDEYTQKIINNKNMSLGSVPTLSGQNPKKSALIEEKRTDKNRKEQNITPRALLEAENIPNDLITQWLSVRKAKRAQLTELALAATKREASKARLSLLQAIQVCCENSWAGFKAEYIKNHQQQQSNKEGVVTNKQFNEWLESDDE